MKKSASIIFYIILVISVLAGAFFAPADTAFAVENNSPQETIEDTINWKKRSLGVKNPSEATIFTQDFLKLAGNSACDWFVLGMGAYGYPEKYNSYLSSAAAYVNKKYEKPDNGALATEWHRLALAVAAAGGDPAQTGEHNGLPVNLIADGVYNNANIGKQGINGFIWGLIALDSKRYEVPESAVNTRESLINAILSKEISGGGFALTGNTPDPDITGMAVQALSPYYDSSEEAHNATNRAINWLSSAQGDDGDYKSWGTFNAESTVWALLAALSLEIDPLTDTRFIKNGNTLLDGIIKYRNADGSFAHSETTLGKASAAASEQVLYGLTGFYRFQNGMSNIFDLRGHTATEADYKDSGAGGKGCAGFKLW